MKTVGFLLAVLLLVWPQSVLAGTGRRFVLAAGANAGGGERPALRYAVSDAEHFTRVLEDMGGLLPGDRILLREPGTRAFSAALDSLRERVAAAPEEIDRTEVLVYYSGHADAEGLLLADGLLSYGKLRRALEQVDADVRIAVLDACASGAITRFKGGQRQPAFLVDVASDMQGYAFLTSSSEDEAAQESDRIGGSFFTHFLVSGLRGAADASGDGRVTLAEAYQFAFDETLAQTARTRGGAQHPTRDIDMTGTGDIVMTDVSRTSAGLLLGEELEGRFFVRNADQQLVAELYKAFGRSVELGLEPGAYEILLDQRQTLFFSTPELEEGLRFDLKRQHFQPVDPEPTALRGGAGWRGGTVERLAGRSRLELRLGQWSRQLGKETELQRGLVSVAAGGDVLIGFTYSRWLREDLAATFSFTALGGEVNTEVGGAGVSTRSVGLVSFLAGVRRYLPASTLRTSFRPFLEGGFGTFIGGESGTGTDFGVDVKAHSMAAFGGQIGGGADLLVGRRFMIGARGGFNLMTDFSEPLAGRKNYSGFELSIGLSWLFGRAYGLSAG